MVASHDLYQDLQVSREDIQKRREQDSKLDQLLDEYNDLDNQVLAGESISAGNAEDDAVQELKERRRAVKDRIAHHLQGGQG
ncbi:MAG: DUF465 domain-containing protein [Pseudomonas profundi]|uniref:DUF465 domain-containing protein n=1 Tax=Pseudomonas TaxID=286 RepID=UPI0014515FED|nr:DUF465 domain-containing protein [Pseudomonas sp. gcc21]QJD58708.1 DUF465 domain-containing protein [Pseudomonas sp. gcc21]